MDRRSKERLYRFGRALLSVVEFTAIAGAVVALVILFMCCGG